MAERIELRLREEIKGVLEKDPNHKDKRFLEGVLITLEGYNARGRADGRTEAVGALITEHPLLRDRIPAGEKKILREKGAAFVTLTGETIEVQIEARRKEGKPSFWHVVDAGNRERLLALPSRRIEVAIFPDPKEFFVPGSFNKDIYTQERMAAADAKRLGLEGITQIIPDEASTLTELVFTYQQRTGVWLFGRKYVVAQGLSWVYGRTKNPTNEDGSKVASVGHAVPVSGLDVDDCYRVFGNGRVGAVRLVVAMRTR